MIHEYKYYEDTYPSSQLPTMNAAPIPYVNEITLRNQSGEDDKEDYNYDGKPIRKPLLLWTFSRLGSKCDKL